MHDHMEFSFWFPLKKICFILSLCPKLRSEADRLTIKSDLDLMARWYVQFVNCSVESELYWVAFNIIVPVCDISAITVPLTLF